jgi:hypothetical protein
MLHPVGLSGQKSVPILFKYAAFNNVRPQILIQISNRSLYGLRRAHCAASNRPRLDTHVSERTEHDTQGSTPARMKSHRRKRNAPFPFDALVTETNYRVVCQPYLSGSPLEFRKGHLLHGTWVSVGDKRAMHRSCGFRLQSGQFDNASSVHSWALLLDHGAVAQADFAPAAV